MDKKEIEKEEKKRIKEEKKKEKKEKKEKKKKIKEAKKKAKEEKKKAIKALGNNKNETDKDTNFCDFCYRFFKDSLIEFENCNHSICHFCAFEKIFMNISLLQGQGKITIQCECDNDTLELSLTQIFNILKSKRKQDLNKKNKDGFENIENTIEGCECTMKKEGHTKQLFSDYFCLDCLEWVCKKCRISKANYHYLHRVLKSRQMIQYIRDNIFYIPLKNKNIEMFEKKWEEQSNNFQTAFDKKFNTTIEKIEQLIESAQKLKQYYVEEYEKQIKNYIKTFKIIKYFYINYYTDKEEELNKNVEYNDIFKLKYLSNITNEFKSFSINHSQEFEKKIDDIKNKIDELKVQNTKIVEANFKYEKIDKGYEIDDIIVGHKSFISSLMVMNDKIISGARDYSMRIWEKGEDGKYLVKQEVKTRQIVSMLGLKNGKILLSESGSNQIKIYDLDNKNEYHNTQSISNHDKLITSIAELEDEKFVSCSLDGKINIWEENKKMNEYIVKQTIQTERPILLLITLDEFKIAYTNMDNGIISIIKAESELVNDKITYKEFSNSGCDLKKVKGKVSCMCKLNDGCFASGGGSVSKTVVDNNIYIWKPEGDSFILGHTMCNAHNTDISSITLLRDGKMATASRDRSIRIWSIISPLNGKIQVIQLHKLDHYGHGLFKLVQLTDDRLAVSASDNNIVIYKTLEGILNL